MVLTFEPRHSQVLPGSIIKAIYHLVRAFLVSLLSLTALRGPLVRSRRWTASESSWPQISRPALLSTRGELRAAFVGGLVHPHRGEGDSSTALMCCSVGTPIVLLPILIRPQDGLP